MTHNKFLSENADEDHSSRYLFFCVFQGHITIQSFHLTTKATFVLSGDVLQ